MDRNSQDALQKHNLKLPMLIVQSYNNTGPKLTISGSHPRCATYSLCGLEVIISQSRSSSQN